jgi:protein-L-isoaspartate(D-aspartate) O-methyltransferase
LEHIEIIKSLANAPAAIYDDLIGRGYTEYKSISTKNGERLLRLGRGRSFRQDYRYLRHRSHPPPLLSQLRPNGIMAIPVGPVGQHVILKVGEAAA